MSHFCGFSAQADFCCYLETLFTSLCHFSGPSPTEQPASVSMDYHPPPSVVDRLRQSLSDGILDQLAEALLGSSRLEQFHTPVLRLEAFVHEGNDNATTSDQQSLIASVSSCQCHSGIVSNYLWLRIAVPRSESHSAYPHA